MKRSNPLSMAALTVIAALSFSTIPSCYNTDGTGVNLPDKPNVIFIAIEDFNPEHFGCYGGDAITPNIDKVASEGVIFRNTSCDVAVCNPSRTALLTALRPYTSGVFGNADNWQELALPQLEATMPQHFKNNGYEALKIGKMFHLNMEHPESWSTLLPTKVEGRPLLSAWHQDVVPTLKSIEGATEGGWFNENLHWGPYDCEPGDFRDGHYATVVANFLAEAHEKPFFLGVGFHAPHVKFSTPKQFFDMYDLNDIKLPDNPPNDLDDVPTLSGKNPIHDVLDSLTWKDIIRAQFACITYVDWCLGEILEALEENNLDENTIIVIWTDHGFALGEHFQWSKGGNKLFNEVTRNGYIWKVPGITPKGAVTNSVVETIDMFPTLFELCNLEIPSTAQGESFVHLLKDPSLPGKPASFTWGSRNRVSIQTERYRLNTDRNLDPATFELYDHKIDPDEFVNVSCNPQYLETIQTLITYYEDHVKKYNLFSIE